MWVIFAEILRADDDLPHEAKGVRLECMRPLEDMVPLPFAAEEFHRKGDTCAVSAMTWDEPHVVVYGILGGWS